MEPAPPKSNPGGCVGGVGCVKETGETGGRRLARRPPERGKEKLVFLHSPPVYTGADAPEIVAVLKEYGIRRCFYAHLHGKAIRFAVQGEVDGIRYKLVSADGLQFCPYKIT